MTPSAALELLLGPPGEFVGRRRNMDNSNEYEVFGHLALALGGQAVTDELSENGAKEAFALLNRIFADADVDTIELLPLGQRQVLILPTTPSIE